MASGWQFFVDVGGTFTDVVARRPDGTLVTHKVLSSCAVRGVAGEGSTKTSIIDPIRITDPPNFWTDYRLRWFAADDANRQACSPAGTAHVRRFDNALGALHLHEPLDMESVVGLTYELCADEEAPILAIRYLMGLRRNDLIGSVEVRLGTTRATNALLERKGAAVALVTTKGFADMLKIGCQDRPALFALHIKKREELARWVVEVDERLNAKGEVLRSPDSRVVKDDLERLRREGVSAVAICLLHAHINPRHEELIAAVAEQVGFEEISMSHRVARRERVVSRGDTTVLDAYLGPVVRGYVASLRRSLPQARLRLMTSSGGLIDAASATGKDTLLSGPAGGVVACAYSAGRSRLGKCIGFDMGGTSTDVSRVEEPPSPHEFVHETVLAGVRVMTPMLAVETVAAGGGSICSFDGQMLHVGPESAGAAPGPACYGRGGPLTVTDMNLYLGRIAPEFFPFGLDREIVHELLSHLCHQVSDATGVALSPIALAEGCIKIANAKMAAAIKHISVAKGYDVREYALNCFGGAGGQHACAVARLLGIRRICVSPFAGVFSALGVGVAEVKRLRQRGVDQRLDSAGTSALQRVFERLTEEARDMLIAEGIDHKQLSPPMCTWDVSYAGQASTITLALDSAERTREEFERQHRRLYGYVHEGRAIEIKSVRVELAARSPAQLAFSPTPTPRHRPAPRSAVMVVEGTQQTVPLYLRAELAENDTLNGPAMVVGEGSTLVIDPGWSATVTASGDIVLTDMQSVPSSETISKVADPIQLELFNNRFAAIAEQMGETLRRTALSTNVKERLDYSCALFSPEGDLVVNAPHIPVHLGGMSDCVKCLIEDVKRFVQGDVYITNDPYRGGSHLNDVTVVTPVHDDAGQHILFFAASRAHHAEIGGTAPGSMPPNSHSLAEEGVLIRAFAWVREGRLQADRLRDLLTQAPYPSRTPEENLADIAAQVAANQTGVRALRAMIARYGPQVVHAYMRHIQTAAENKMRVALRKLPTGVHRFQDQLDDGSAIRLAVTIRNDRAVFDFTGTDAVLPGNLNANRSIVTSAIMYCLRCLIDEDIPLNAGVLAPVDIILPECLLNPKGSADPRKCPAMVGGNVETSQRIVDCIFGALRTVAASQGTMNNLLLGNEQFGYYETICGGSGAGSGFHGADAVHTHMTNTRMTDPEVLEARYPVRLVQFRIRKGSGGAGQYCGGEGVVRELEFLAPLEVSILSQRRTTAPYGLCGGRPGMPGRNLLRRAGGEVEELPPIAQAKVNPGDHLTIETPGGGGFGPAP